MEQPGGDGEEEEEDDGDDEQVRTPLILLITEYAHLLLSIIVWL